MSNRLLKESDVIEAFKGRESLIHDVYTATAIIRSVPSADRPQGVYDAIALVNRETEREDLSEEIKKYLFCDLRKKLWGLDSRPQGEWIVSSKDSICPICGKDEAEFICGTEDWYGYGLSNYCPNCGCRMKGVDDE